MIFYVKYSNCTSCSGRVCFDHLGCCSSQRVRQDWVTELNWTVEKPHWFTHASPPHFLPSLCTACINNYLIFKLGFTAGAAVKNLPASADLQDMQVRSLGQEDPRSRKWQRTPVFLSGKFHGWRSLAGYSPLSRKELDTVKHAQRQLFKLTNFSLNKCNLITVIGKSVLLQNMYRENKLLLSPL